MAAPNFRFDDEESFTPFAKAVFDSFADGVVVFNSTGEMIFASEQARVTAEWVFETLPPTADALLPELAKMGAQLRSVRTDGLSVGKVIFLPVEDPSSTLAQREKATIIKTLDAKGWKLTDAAVELGISRTTLWRRIRVYGLKRRNKNTAESV
jgi:transcriptional regulator of acetoin/glycerol metabolism